MTAPQLNTPAEASSGCRQNVVPLDPDSDQGRHIQEQLDDVFADVIVRLRKERPEALHCLIKDVA